MIFPIKRSQVEKIARILVDAPGNEPSKRRIQCRRRPLRVASRDPSGRRSASIDRGRRAGGGGIDRFGRSVRVIGPSRRVSADRETAGTARARAGRTVSTTNLRQDGGPP